MILETDRLTLRPWTVDDFEALAAMSADPEVMRFLAGDGKPMARFGAWQSLASTVGHWALRGFGMFAVIERSSGEFVGRVGPWQPEGWPDFEIGWALRSQYWGKGYGREHLVSLILPDNVRSIRVAERLGERRTDARRLEAQTIQHRITAIFHFVTFVDFVSFVVCLDAA